MRAPTYSAATFRKPTSIAHILDDGFQHRQLHRDVDILLLDPRRLARQPAARRQSARTAAVRPCAPPSLPFRPTTRVSKPNSKPGAGQGQSGACAAAWKSPASMVPSPHSAASPGPSNSSPDSNPRACALAGRIAFPDHHRYSRSEMNRLSQAAAKPPEPRAHHHRKGRSAAGPLVSLNPGSICRSSPPSAHRNRRREADVVDRLAQSTASCNRITHATL